LKDRNQIKFQK